MPEEKEDFRFLDESKLDAFVRMYAPVDPSDEFAIAKAEEYADDRLRNYFGCWREPGMPDELPLYIQELIGRGYERGTTWDGVSAFFVIPLRTINRVSAPLFTEEEQDEAQRDVLGIGEDIGSPTLLPGERHDIVKSYPQDITKIEDESA